MKTFPTAMVLTTMLAAAGCGSQRATSDAGLAARPVPPPVQMAGRWLFASPGRGQCTMNFNGTPGASEGTIAPAGGCPGNFFTSRRWTFDSEGLTISDHNAAPLAKLAVAGTSFNGQAGGGEAVTLSR